MSEYVYPGSCEECRYFDLDCDQFPCSDCKHNIPPSCEEYNTAPEYYKPCYVLDHPVTHPSHYTQGGIECIQAMEAAFGKEAVATWSKLNAFKYIWRAVHKNGMEDIDKAIWYLNKYKELMSSGRTEAV